MIGNWLSVISPIIYLVYLHHFINREVKEFVQGYMIYWRLRTHQVSWWDLNVPNTTLTLRVFPALQPALRLTGKSTGMTRTKFCFLLVIALPPFHGEYFVPCPASSSDKTKSSLYWELLDNAFSVFHLCSFPASAFISLAISSCGLL